MEEKIKITLNQVTLDVLKCDCIDFGIVKRNGEPNMNAFINQLVANFYHEFSATNERMNDKLRLALSHLPSNYIDTTFNEVIKIMQKPMESHKESKQNKVNLNFKPTKVSAEAIFYINNLILKNESLASFYRRMFADYAKKTRPDREKIIFASVYEVLQTALKKNCQVCIALSKGTVISGACPYSVACSKDELFNYLLFVHGNTPNTVRLANIVSVALMTNECIIPDNIVKIFKKQIACGAQYPIFQHQKENIKVKLTTKGKTLFKKIYLYRPTPIAIEGDIYTFACSYNQIIYYFKRFGDGAVILYPKRLGIEMQNYHKFALKKYDEYYKH